MSPLKKEQRKILIIDECFKDIDIVNISRLGVVADGKLNLHCSNDYLDHLKHLLKSDHEMLLKIQNPEEYDDGDEYLIVQLIKANHLQIVELIAEFGANLQINSK